MISQRDYTTLYMRQTVTYTQLYSFISILLYMMLRNR